MNKIDRVKQQTIIQESYKCIRKYEKKEISTKADTVNKIIAIIENVLKEEKKSDN